ncbi:MAG: peptidoglycan-associated lipoprotein Pal [Burkholderiaceae bacterium]|jgi:peptidoglycan-associated lipoprotein|nr:peptidoglycan-associated lipoprotein Pal [Burkholderiaceae bacterium]
MMKRYLMATALAVVLAGCGSSKVALDESAEGTSGSSRASTGTGATTQGAGQGGVTGVDTGNASDAQGPASVGRVILFDFDSYIVKPEYQGLVDQHGRFLQARRNRNVSLEGHTDERGSREYNLALGQKRAEAVRRALILVGASDAQLEAVSFGKEKPVATGNSEEAYSQNRRVELRYR